MLCQGVVERHDQDHILAAYRHRRQLKCPGRLRAEQQVEPLLQKPVQKFLRHTGVERESEVTLWILLKKAGGQARHKIHPQRSKQSQADQPLAAGRPPEFVYPFIQCGQSFLGAGKKLLPEACQRCGSSRPFKQRHAHFRLQLADGVT